MLLGLTYLREKTYKGSSTQQDCTARVCYVLKYTNPVEIPKGTTINLSVSGTSNQDSVRTAGDFQVITQLYEIAEPATVYAIDEGSWPTDFTTTPGAVTSTTGKVMEASTFVTYAAKAAYTISFTTYQYIPKGGILTLAMPTGVEIASDP